MGRFMPQIEVVILDMRRGSRRLDSQKSEPRGLFTSPDGNAVLDWISAAIATFTPIKTTYFGSYQIQKVIEKFPNFDYRFLNNNGIKGEFEVVKLMLEQSSENLLILRADSIVLPDAITALVHDFETLNTSYIRVNGKEIFAGAFYIPNRIRKQLLLRMNQMATTGLAEAIEQLFRGEKFNSVDMSGLIAPLNNHQAIRETVFKGKALTLEQLSRVDNSFTILDQVSFTVRRWRTDSMELIKSITSVFPSQLLVVRSSSLSEDSANSSAAGFYESVLNVNSDDESAISRAIEKVISSYAKLSSNEDDQILVQPQIQKLDSCGVLFTREIATRAPYFVISIDRHSGRSDVVTSGLQGDIETYYVAHWAPTDALPKDISRVVEGSKELIKLASFDELDIEFAFDRSGKLYLFQMRPIVFKPVKNSGFVMDLDLQELSQNAKEFAQFMQSPSAHIVGGSNVLSNMSDWNPAEMIGSSPNPLALSLYQFLIGDSSWSESRARLGYRNVKPLPLIVSIGGKPYVDVRASLNSFIPNNVADSVATKWIDYCLERLRNEPSLNDKIEFELTPTCFTFNLDSYDNHFRLAGLNVEEARHFKSSYRAMTLNWLKGGEIEKLLASIEQLTLKRQARELNTNTSTSGQARVVSELLDDCKNLGTIPFASLARMAFVGLALLRSLRELGVFTVNEYNNLLKAIPTVATEMQQDLQQLRNTVMSREAFLSKYGHLREHSYEISSPNYAQSFNRLFGDRNKLRSAENNQSSAKSIFMEKKKKIIELLATSQFDISIDELFDFIHTAITAREFAKFEFMKSVDLILKTLKELGENYGISKDDLSFLPLDELLVLSKNSCSGATGARFKRSISFHRKLNQLTRCLRLPDVIGNSREVDAHCLMSWKPNFVTLNKVTAEVVVLSDNRNDLKLDGKIIAIQAADPGFDWIFCHAIVGLITQYGGVGSHMAIRAAEFSIPAAIGCGEDIFNSLDSGSFVTLDCEKQLLVNAS